MLTNDIKKGMKIKTDQLGMVVNGTMEDSKKSNVRFIKTYGSELGLFDEYGSVYAWNIVAVENCGVWEKIHLTDKQLRDKAKLKAIGF